MLRIAVAIGVGLLAGFGFVALVGVTNGPYWALPVGLIVTIMSSVFLSIGRTTRTVTSAPESLVSAARDAQQIGLVRIESLTQTGTRINNQPLCDLELVVKPLHGEAYRTRTRELVLLTDLAKRQPGSTHGVVIPVEGQPDVVFAEGLDERLLRQIALPSPSASLPLRVPPPGGLKADGTRVTPLLSMNPSTRWLRALLYLVVAVAAAVLVALPYRTAITQSVTAWTQGQWRPDYRNADILQHAFDELRAQTGDTQVFEVRASKDMIWITAPVSDGAIEADDWMYRDGSLEKYSASSVQPDDAREQFPVDDVAWDRLLPTAEKAAAQVNLTGSDQETSFTASRSRSDADTDSDDYGLDIGPVELIFSLSDAYHSYTFTTDADGGNLTKVE